MLNAENVEKRDHMRQTIQKQELTRRLLRQLGIPIQQGGYRKLCVAIPRYAEDPEQSMSKDLYPYVAKILGCDGDVESSIRRSILTAWKQGSAQAWQNYFPGITKAPSNRVFIATLAEYLLW